MNSSMNERLRLPNPFCAVCGKVVKVVSYSYLPASQQVRFTAYCHGAVEETVLDERDIVMGGISQGVAFDKDRKLGEELSSRCLR